MNFRNLLRAACYYVVHTQNCSTIDIQRVFQIQEYKIYLIIDVMLRLGVGSKNDYEDPSYQVDLKTIYELETTTEIRYKINWNK